MGDDDKEFSMEKWFDKAQDSYTAWENGLWDKLGTFGAWMKKRRDKKVPDWKRVQDIWVLISILALLTGYNLAGYYFEYQCNKHIVEEFYPEVACQNGLKCSIDNFNFLNNDTLIKDLPLLKKGGVGVP